MGKASKILDIANRNGLRAARQVAEKEGLNLFEVAVGPASRVEVWNRGWNRMLASGHHVSKYAEIGPSFFFKNHT